MPKPPEKHRKSSSRSSHKGKDSDSIVDKEAKEDEDKVFTSSPRKGEHHEKKPLVVENEPNDENSCERLCCLPPEMSHFDKTGLPFKYYTNKKAEGGVEVDAEEFVRLWKDYKKNGEVTMSTRGRGKKGATVEKEGWTESEDGTQIVLEKMRRILETKGHLDLNEFEQLL